MIDLSERKPKKKRASYEFGPVWLGAAHWEMSAPGAIRYLLRYRIEKAAGLLLSTEKKAGEIATICGFSDISYFTRRFREINGCTPLEYRKENI